MAAGVGSTSRFRYLQNLGDTSCEHARGVLGENHDSPLHPQVIVERTDEWVRPWFVKSNPNRVTPKGACARAETVFDRK